MLAVVMTLPAGGPTAARPRHDDEDRPAWFTRGRIFQPIETGRARSAAGAPVRHQGHEGLALLLGRLDGGGAEGVREAGKDLAHQAVTGPGSDLPRLTPLLAAEGRDGSGRGLDRDV